MSLGVASVGIALESLGGKGGDGGFGLETGGLVGGLVSGLADGLTGGLRGRLARGLVGFVSTRQAALKPTATLWVVRLAW